MIRYQIRNEYGLSDPGLCAPGEKDDPEALLEGVAMAGLVGVLRQLGDLAEFAAEIFHDLHEEVMATASRGHGLMLRLQQLEADFPAVEKAIISQTDHSNYPHDDGIEWHTNLQLNQNMITQGDMPRFILDSYEECRGPPRLFTLDKFDVAGAGASLKRYSNPSFFKTEHASNMIETKTVIEKRSRKKKKAMRWRKGETLESLLVVNSESHTTSKERASRKVPPRTTKLKYRHPRDSDCKTISRICREHLQEVISSQQKILFNYSARHYHAKFRSTDSSETVSAFGELDNFSAPAQSSAKLELTKVFPINECDTMETASTPINGSACLEADDGQSLATQHGPAKVEEVDRSSLEEQSAVFSNSKKLQEGPVFVVEESNYALQSAREGKLLLAVVSADQDVDRCRPDDTGSDQDNFVDALNNMESEGETDPEMKTKRDLRAKTELNKLNFHREEGENALHTQFSELGHAVNLSPGLNDSCSGGEPICVDSFLTSDSSPAMSTAIHPNSDPTSCRQSNGVDWTNNEEPSNDVDLMDVSSSSSVLSDDNGNFETNDGINGCEQYQEASLSSNDYHAAVGHSSDKHQPQKSSGLDGFTIYSNDCIEKAYHSVEHDRNFALDGTSKILGKPYDVSQNNEEIEVGNADDSLLHSTISNQEEMLKSKKQFEVVSLHTSTSPGKVASLPDMDLFTLTKDLDLDNVAVPKEFTNTAPTGLGPDYTHKHLDELDSGVAPTHSSMLNNPSYESHDDEIVEELRSLPDEDLYKHVEEDDEIVAQKKGSCSVSTNTYQEDPMQASVPRDLSNVQEFPRLTEAVSPLQEDTEAHVGETLVPSSCMLSDDKTTSLIGIPLACSNASVLDNSSSCVEHRGSTETGGNVECDEVLVDVEDAEESTTGRFADAMVPFKEELADGAKYTEKTEFVATNPKEENSRHGAQSQSSSPCREELETVEATYKNLGPLDESTEHINKRRMLQAEDPPQHIETETSGETCNNVDDIHNLSSLHYRETSVSQEDLPEETSLSAEVLYQCDLDKVGGTVDLKSNMVREQPANVDQDLVRVLSAEDTFGTNPFMDPGYKVIHTLTDPSPSMSYQPCFSEEEQDFISEILIQHGSMGAKENLFPVADSLWEPATPPDEAPLPSEVMTEEDFRSFCHEYHEMDFTSVAVDDKPVPDSNDISNGLVASELEFPYSASALPVGLYQEPFVCSNSDSQVDECSSTKDIQAENNDMSNGFVASELEFPYSASALQMGLDQEACVCSTDSQVDECSSTKEDPDDRTLGINSDLKSHEPFSEKKIPELDVPSVQMELKEEQHALPGADSHSGSRLLDDDKIGEKYVSPSGNIPVKEEQEICANLVPRAFINENIDKLDVPPSNSGSVEPEERTHGPDDYDYQDVPCSITNEEIDELNVHPLSKPVQIQESEVHALGQLDSQAVPSSLINEAIDDLELPPLSTDLEAEQESEDHVSGEHNSQVVPSSLINEAIDDLELPPLSTDLEAEQESEDHVSGERNSQITTPFFDERIDELDAPTLSNVVLVEKEPKICVPGELASQITTPLLDEKIDELDAPTLSDVVLVEKEPKICVPGELASQIASCSSSSEEIYELDDPPLSNSVLVQLESEDHVSGDLDSQITPRSSNNDKIDEPDTATSTHILPVEVKKEACLSPELDSQIAPCSLNDAEACEPDGPPSCNVQVKSEKGSYCSTEVDSEIAPCSSDSVVLTGKSAVTSTSEETYGLSHVPPSSETFPYASYEDPQKPPPLPPLQWRLGRPCLGLLNTKGYMPESIRRTSPVLLAPNPEMDNWPGSLHGMAESKELVSSQEIRERHQSSMVDKDDPRVEFRRLSAHPTETNVARTEQVRPFSGARENIKHQERVSSSETETTEEHPNDTGITDAAVLHPTNLLLIFEHGISQQGPQGSVLSSDISDNSEHPSYTYRALSEDDKTVDDHNATGGLDLLYTMSPLAAGHVLENGRYQQSQHDESHSENSNDKEHTLHAPYEETGLKEPITSEAPSDATNRSALGLLLEEGNSQESQILQGQNAENLKSDQSEDPLPSEESAGCQDYPCDDHNLEAEDKHQPNQYAAWPGDNNYVSGPHEGSYAHAEQPPVMGWTVGPQMLHPNYGISIDENQFEQKVADHRPIKKPISIRNIPRNPLVDAVAAHDRSTMRKVSELVPPTDKPKPDERNLLLEQIRNKTFNLKPVGSANLTAIRASTRNLRVAAIIEKANAIRQAVGSDDEDGDNWSDT